MEKFKSFIEKKLKSLEAYYEELKDVYLTNTKYYFMLDQCFTLLELYREILFEMENKNE